MQGEDRPIELLDGETAQKYITQYLKSMTEKDMCALFMVGIDKTEDIAQHPGEKTYITRHAGHVLSPLFKSSDIVSRLGENEFIVFLTGEITKEEAAGKARTLCAYMPFEPEHVSGARMTACVGVYLAYGGGISFEKLFGQAATALYEAKKCGRGSYYILDSRKMLQDRRYHEAKEVSGISLNTLLEYMDSGVALLEIGPQIRIIYASHGLYHMLGRDRDSFHVPLCLSEIGIHPDYEADYEEALREGAGKEGVTDHVHRISSNGKDWIWRHVRAAKVTYPGREYPVMLELSTDISQLIRTERQLRVSNERLRVAFHQTPHVLWEVDIEEKIFNIYNVDEEKCQQNTIVGDFPQSFLDKNIVHPDSAADFREFADNLMRGRAAGKGNFMMRDRASHSYGWVSMSYRMTYNEEGNPLKAVGVWAKFPELAGIGSSVMRRRPFPETARRHLIIRMKINLTKDTVEELWMGGMDQTAWTWGKTYSEMIDLNRHFLFARSDEKKFSERYKRSNLLKAYRDGEIWSKQEYQKVDEAGNIGWFMDLVNLVKDEETGDICMYACGMDSQLRHDWEKLAEGEVQRDSVTGLYAMKTVRDIVKPLLKKQKGTGQCALSLIRIMGGERSRDTQRFMATVLSMALGMDSVVGQYSRDIILAFIPEAGSRFDVKRRIEDAFAYMRISMADISELSALRLMAGTVTGQGRETDYDEMLVRAGLLCDAGNDLAVDTVLFPTEEDDWAWSSLHREAEEDEIIVVEHEPERLLTREEQTAAFNCVTGMLSAKNLDTSLTDSLRDLGRFYNAARTYILRVSEDRQAVDMVYEWTCRGKQSIRHVMQGVQMKKIPLIKNSYQEGKAVIMESPPSISQHSEDRGKWRFAAYPLREKDKITGFLCVENAKNHLGDTALLSVLAPYVIREEQRFQNMAAPVLADGQDTLTRLPNLSSYMDVVYSLDSDSYSSMGVMSLDIPNYSAINSSYGFEYGKKMLLFIANTLTSVFGKTYIFRTWDAEFVVLFPNVIHEVFTGRCTRLRAMIQRRYPRQVRMGYVWAEGIFSARQMVREAQTIMHNENVKEPDVERESAPEGEPRKSEVSKKNFVPYFQPKIDMRDGRLVGAEAVVRKIGEDGSIISPSRFVNRMEQNGSIRELDLFMLCSRCGSGSKRSIRCFGFLLTCPG